MPAGATPWCPHPAGAQSVPRALPIAPSAPFPMKWGSGSRQEHPPGPGTDPPCPSTPCPQHPPSRQHQTRYNPALISAAANSAQRRKSKSQTAPFLPQARPQCGVIFSPPRAGKADNTAPCENCGREETCSIAPTTSRILTLSLPSGRFLAWRQQDHSAQHPMPTPRWVLPLPAAQDIVPVQHDEGRSCCPRVQGLFLVQGG